MLILHAGMPKTATTTLQHFLAASGAYLGLHDIVYPDRWRDDGGIAHHALGNAITAGSHAEIDAITAEIEDYLSERRGNPTIISTEGLTNACVAPRNIELYEFLIRLGRIAPVKFVMSLRRIDDFMESMYLQEVKVGMVRTPIENYVAARETWVQSLFETLGAMRDSRMAHNVHFPAYSKSVDFLQNLAAALGLPASVSAQITTVKSKNLRLGVKGQTVLLLLPELEAELGISLPRDAIIDALEAGDLSFEDDRINYQLLPRPWAKFIHELALRMALQARIGEYYEAFKDKTVGTAETHVLERCNLTAADLERLRCWIENNRG